MKQDGNHDIYRTVILTILTGLAVATVAFANRDIYTRSEIDQRFQASEQVSEVRFDNLSEDVQEMKEDLKWIIHQMKDSNVSE